VCADNRISDASAEALGAAIQASTELRTLHLDGEWLNAPQEAVTPSSPSVAESSDLVHHSPAGNCWQICETVATNFSCLQAMTSPPTQWSIYFSRCAKAKSGTSTSTVRLASLSGGIHYQSEVWIVFT
jgi:hypothetical protein